MIKYLITKYTIDRFSEHDKIKHELLNLIQNSESERLEQNDEYYGDNVARLDWHKSKDNLRPWVKYFLPYFKNQVSKMVYELGFEQCDTAALWYQQYEENSTHGWHTHSQNYTGVYYLEMPEGTPKTQLVDENKNVEIVDLDVNEGDFIIFPSFVIHRAPKNLSKDRKTIISFNIDVSNIRKDILDRLK